MSFLTSRGRGFCWGLDYAAVSSSVWRSCTESFPLHPVGQAGRLLQLLAALIGLWEWLLGQPFHFFVLLSRTSCEIIVGMGYFLEHEDGKRT